MKRSAMSARSRNRSFFDQKKKERLFLTQIADANVAVPDGVAVVLKQNMPRQSLAEHFQILEFTPGYGSLQFVTAEFVSQHNFAVQKVLHSVSLDENAR